MNDHDAHAHDPADVNYGLYVMVWIALLALTQFTVTAAQLHLGQLGIAIAVLVTPAKALLVLYYFMHLKYEKLIFKVMFCFAVFILIVAIAGTFFDVAYR